MSFDREKANRELAELTGIVPHVRRAGTATEFVWWSDADGNSICSGGPSDFFVGLRPDGTCDEAAVDGELLWKVMRALALYSPTLNCSATTRNWHTAISLLPFTPDRQGMRRWDAAHAHPILALYLCARAAGLLKGETDAE